MITILCGKSASGKDTLLRELVREGYEPIVSCTSRPMREGEVDGKDYHFISRKEFEDRIHEDGFIEYRTYDTLVGGHPDTWYYGMAKQKFDDKDYIVILDLDGAEAFQNYIKKEYDTVNCLSFYIHADDDVRTKRAMSRGSFDEMEWKRRLVSDNERFTDERITEICDCRLNNNKDLDALLKDFITNSQYMKSILGKEEMER